MSVNVRLFVGDTLFEDLDENQQNSMKKEVTDIYANQIMKEIKIMIKEGKTIDEIKNYLLIN